jgi:cytochrome c553
MLASRTPLPRCLYRIAGAVALCLATPAALRAGGADAAKDRNGEQVYRQMCASCHGPNGEGTVEEYPRALTGDRSVAQLSKLIAKTMPADEPGTCTGPDAEKVAAYIHEAFYSRTAQERNKPARIELSRLTVRQYRNAVADLIGSFRKPAPPWGERHGLQAEYYRGRQFRGGDPDIVRVDPTVQFDFGVDTPDPAKLKDHSQFSIRWEGSVLAPESGEYEFIVKTEHAMRLWVNDLRKPLVDGTVQSGKDTEYHVTIPLLGGRAYPIKLEFSKGTGETDEQKKKKNKPKPFVHASVSLEWKPPQRAAEIIPERNLSPETFPETYVATAAFPPDDRSTGFERGTSVSKAWDQATTEAAIETVDYVSARLAKLSGIDDGDGDRAAKLREFCRTFAERAFRRPLTDEQKRLVVDRQFEEARDPVTAVKRSLLLTLKSPYFLYREITPGAPDSYDVASRLSFGLWDSIPDQALLDAAAAGKLGTRDEVAKQAERMLADLRIRSKLRDFFFQWLKVEQPPDVSKDPEKYPGFDAAVLSDLRTSLELSVEDAVWGESSDFRQLLLADYLYLNGRLAKYYGAILPADVAFKKVYLEPRERAGVLSHPYLMATFAYTSASSPIHRGVFVARSVLGRALKPPPEAAAPLAPDLHPSLTTRERVALQTNPVACQTCHNMINPLGYPLERFDAVGRFRDEEKARPIDATGTYQTVTGGTASFNGARDFAAFLAGSPETHAAIVEQVFHHLVKQPIRAYGPKTADDLRAFFAGHGHSIRKLAVEIMAATAPAPRVENPPAQGAKVASGAVGTEREEKDRGNIEEDKGKREEGKGNKEQDGRVARALPVPGSGPALTEPVAHERPDPATRSLPDGIPTRSVGTREVEDLRIGLAFPFPFSVFPLPFSAFPSDLAALSGPGTTALTAGR